MTVALRTRKEAIKTLHPMFGHKWRLATDGPLWNYIPGAPPPRERDNDRARKD